jgi:hypothetical protein
MVRVIVETDGGKRGGQRGRSFPAEALAVVVADGPEEEYEWGAEWRPAYALLGATERVGRFLEANLRTGRRLLSDDEVLPPLVFKKSAKYVVDSLALPLPQGTTGVQVQAYLPRRVGLMAEPEAAIDFAAITPAAWAVAQVAAFRESAACGPYLDWARRELTRRDGGVFAGVAVGGDEDLLLLVPTAVRFLRALRSRTRCPIVPDQRFAVRLLLEALRSGVASLGVGQVGRWGRRRPEALPRDVWPWARHEWAQRAYDVGAHTSLTPTNPTAAVLLPTVHVRTQADALERCLADWTMAHVRAVAPVPRSLPVPTAVAVA